MAACVSLLLTVPAVVTSRPLKIHAAPGPRIKQVRKGVQSDMSSRDGMVLRSGWTCLSLGPCPSQLSGKFTDGKDASDLVRIVRDYAKRAVTAFTVADGFG